MPLQRAVYFVANIDSGAGMKVIALPIPGIQNEFHGLIMTVDTIRRPLVARVVLRRTRHAAADEGEIASFPEGMLAHHVAMEAGLAEPAREHEEEARELRRQMRNEIREEEIGAFNSALMIETDV